MAQAAQNPRSLSERCVASEGGVFGATTGGQKVDATGSCLEGGAQSVCDPLWGPGASMKKSYIDILTPPAWERPRSDYRWGNTSMNSLSINEEDLIRVISPNDQMFDPAAGEHSYFSRGRSALDGVAISLQAAHKAASDVKRILDLPCGHGRILRYLTAAFPPAELTALDRLNDGVDFCASTFGAIPVYSQDDPATIPLEQRAFDLIWVGSLFTHFDADMWPTWLTVFCSLLRSGGVLVFTTHGRQAYENMANGSFNYNIPASRERRIRGHYERSGFGHVKYPGLYGYYGLTLSEPAWVLRQIARLGDIRVVLCSERAWAGFHDIFACVCDPDWQVQHQAISACMYLRQKVSQGLTRLDRFIHYRTLFPHRSSR